jgi:hypothetical protein
MKTDTLKTVETEEYDTHINIEVKSDKEIRLRVGGEVIHIFPKITNKNILAKHDLEDDETYLIFRDKVLQ